MGKRYTWVALRRLAEGSCSSVRGALRRAPRRWRRALALGISVAKWDPKWGRPDACWCGLCEYYRRNGGYLIGCGTCPLKARWGCTCNALHSPWRRWEGQWRVGQEEQRAQAAARIHRDLLALYGAELRRLGWLPGEG